MTRVIQLDRSDLLSVRKRTSGRRESIDRLRPGPAFDPTRCLWGLKFLPRDGDSESVNFNRLDRTKGAPMESLPGCELCVPQSVLLENPLAYAQLEKNSLSDGHVIVVPRRHVADFFEMTHPEQIAVMDLLNRAHALMGSRHSPDGYNIGVNVGRAAGQSRLHVHVHLIPRYTGDVANPEGGIRCVLAGNRAA